MLSLIRDCVRQELSSIFTAILVVVMFIFIVKRAIESLDAFVYDNEARHRDASHKIDALNHALYHLEEDVDELYDDDASSDLSSDCGSEKVETDHITV